MTTSISCWDDFQVWCEEPWCQGARTSCASCCDNVSCEGDTAKGVAVAMTINLVALGLIAMMVCGICGVRKLLPISPYLAGRLIALPILPLILLAILSVQFGSRVRDNGCRHWN